jgi:hypothetical protein
MPEFYPSELCIHVWSTAASEESVCLVTWGLAGSTLAFRTRSP